MPTPIDYTLFAANSYSTSDDVVSPANRIPIPDGWTIIDVAGNPGVNPITGFLARAYKNDATGEIVISYAGTTSEDGMKTLDWTNGNIPGASGMSLGEQIVDAAMFYLDVRKANPDAAFSFTGHSLGGGLASLMAVYFNKPAHTFDQAPFERSADSATVVNALKNQLTDAGYQLPAEFSAYVPGTTNLTRENLVSHTYVKGEVLRNLGAYFVAFGGAVGGVGGAFAGLGLAVAASDIAGATAEIDANGQGVSATDLHSIVLLAALQQSQKFLDASKANPELLQQLFQSTLYGDQKLAEHNFLNLMVQQQAAGNQALDVFADDAAKFTGVLDPVANGTAGADDKLKSALYALAIGLYYGEGEKRTGTTNTPFEALFKSLSGGIQFTPDPARKADYQTSLTAVMEELGLYFPDIREYLKQSADRYTLPTDGALIAPEIADDKIDLMIGNGQADDLRGGGGNDILLGRAGADTLDGGAGEDTLYGGTDNDTLTGGDGNDLYVINTGDGQDTFVDDGDNRILYNRRVIAGLAIKDPSTGQYKFVDDAGKTLEFNSPGVLTLDDSTQITFQNQTSAEALDGSFGLQLYEETIAPANFDRTIVGDFAPMDVDLATDGIQTGSDDFGNIITDPAKPEPDREDNFKDSGGNDLIRGLGGNDYINAWNGGNDKLDGGAGADIVMGRAGDDIVIGSDGMDLLRGDQGKDTLYAGNEIALDTALSQQDAAPSGQKGDFIDGGADDDTLIGDTGNDALNGGLGDDIILGGAGDDDIDGDLEASLVTPDWSVQRSFSNNTYLSTYLNTEYDLPTQGGDDVIYAGAGADWVRGRYGNDYIDGGAGDDVLFGQEGNDDLFGGAGNDTITGDAGNTPLAEQGSDYLDGEEGNDTLFGMAGDDTLFGGVGNDKLYAGADNDYLDGEAGDDTLMGETGDDELFGGDGADLLIGNEGRDTLYGEAGNDQIAGDNSGSDTSGDADTIDGGDGDDTIDGQGGDDTLFGGNGNDVIVGRLGNDSLSGDAGNDQLQGGDGNDALDGGADSDTLFGQAGNDTLIGGAGNDYLLGGAGDDILDGGDGDDVYYLSAFEGNDRIVDSGGTDWLVLQGIYWGDIVLGVGSLKLTVKSTGQEIHLDDFDPDNPFAAGGIEYFQFADGTVKTRNQIIQELGFTPTGTPGDDVLSGTALNDTITALAGNDIVTARGGNDTVYLDAGDDWADAGDGDDTVWAGDGNDIVAGGNGADRLDGGAGNDVLYGDDGADHLTGGLGADILAGGVGNDTLEGGEGNDTILFGTGDGQDVAIDSAGIDTVQLTGGLTEAQINLQRLGSDLIVAVKGAADKLTVKDWFAPTGNFQSLTLGDGIVLDRAAVEERLVRNQVPVATEDLVAASEDGVTQASGNALANDADPEGRALRVTNPGAYTGHYGALTLSSAGAYTYTLNNNAAAVQSLAAGQTVTERFGYTATDDDPNGAANSSSAIVVSITGANDAPIIAIDRGAVAEDGTLSVAGNVLANDRDIDAGTVLQVVSPGTIVSAYGSATLASDGSYTYTLNNASTAVQSLGRNRQVTERFDYTVSDGIAGVAATLEITVAGANDAPIIAMALSDQTVSTNTAYSWQVPTNSFVDPDYGDVLAYRATLADGSALPSWLVFDAAAQTFSGRVPRDAAGSLDISVIATDGVAGQSGNLSASDVFHLSFASGGGGGGGGGNGGSKGNEGVGNGVDAPPPGHTYSFNDGAGTSPGHPGAQGGNGYRPLPDVARADILIAAPEPEQVGSAPLAHGHGGTTNNGEHVGTSATPAPDEPAMVDAAASNGLALANGHDLDGTPGNSSTSAMANWKSADAWQEPSYLDPSRVNAATGNSYSVSDNTGVENALARWAAMDELLAAHLAKNDEAALGNGTGSGAGMMDASGFLGSTTPFADDQLSLSAGNGNNLKTLQGLKEGFRQAA